MSSSEAGKQSKMHNGGAVPSAGGGGGGVDVAAGMMTSTSAAAYLSAGVDPGTPTSAASITVDDIDSKHSDLLAVGRKTPENVCEAEIVVPPEDRATAPGKVAPISGVCTASDQGVSTARDLRTGAIMVNSCESGEEEGGGIQPHPGAVPGSVSFGHKKAGLRNNKPQKKLEINRPDAGAVPLPRDLHGRGWRNSRSKNDVEKSFAMDMDPSVPVPCSVHGRGLQNSKNKKGARKILPMDPAWQERHLRMGTTKAGLRQNRYGRPGSRNHSNSQEQEISVPKRTRHDEEQQTPIQNANLPRLQLEDYPMVNEYQATNDRPSPPHSVTLPRRDISNSGLAVASAIDDSSESNRIEAEEVDPESLQKQEEEKGRRKECRCIGKAIVAVCFVVLGLSFGLTYGKKEFVVEYETPTPSPTRPLPPMGNLKLLYEELPKKTKESLHNGNSPQYQAWEWLINHPNVTAYPEWRKKQVFAMATFYYSFEGPNWPETFPGNERWMDVTTSECSWVLSDDEVAQWAESCLVELGPTAYACAQAAQPCNEDGKLQSLIVSRLYLPDTLDPSIPPEIEMLTSLRILLIGWGRINSKLSNLLLPEVIELPRLEFLGFHSLGLSGTVPPELSLMSGLRHLWIGYNDFTGKFPFEISRMTSLEHLAFDEMNGITGTLPSEIGLMTSLTALEIARNSLSGPIPSELGLLSHSMWRLLLDGNMFSGSLPGSIWDFSHLDRLHLSNLPNLYGSIPTNVFMPNLTSLSLSGSPSLSGTIPEDICNEELNFDCSDWLCGCGCNCTANANGTSF